MTLVLGTYGGGTNSKAMYIGMVERSEPAPHAILMADTGGEHPHTYADSAAFSQWLIKHGYPAITVVKKNGGKTLEQDCLDRNTLPAIAFGWRTCSQRYKTRPQEQWANNDSACKAEWKAGRKIEKLIGYDYGELGRARFYDDKKYMLRYPLIDWKWDRVACVKAISDAGLTQPGKSSCFFCPHMKKPEILLLKERYPNLLQRALHMEGRAVLTKIKGLGRHFAWKDFIAGQTPEDSSDKYKEPICGCYDGGEMTDADMEFLT